MSDSELNFELASLRKRVAELEGGSLTALHFEILLEAQSSILKAIATNQPLPEILRLFCWLVEGRFPETLCSILLLDRSGQCLTSGAAPSLPDSYNQLIDGLTIGPNRGSCGTAAFERVPVVVSDTDVDPHWADFRGLARQYDLRACWSFPVFSSRGDVLGTFALYYRTPRAPSPEELRLIEDLALLAAIAIERKQLDQLLGETQLKLQSQSSPVPVRA